MIPTILEPHTDAEILATFEVMRQLRPELPREGYVPTIRRMMEREGYRLAALAEDDRVRAVAGYRFMEMLYCGRFLYVDDLVTDERVRSRGHGRRLLDWLKARARARQCEALQLDSGLHRVEAHRFYAREGLDKRSYHFEVEV